MKTENIKLPLITNTFTMYNSFLSEITYFHGKQQCHTGDHANVLLNDLHLESEGVFFLFLLHICSKEQRMYSIAQESTTPTVQHIFYFLKSSILLIANDDPQVIAASMWHTSVGLSYQQEGHDWKDGLLTPQQRFQHHIRVLPLPYNMVMGKDYGSEGTRPPFSQQHTTDHKNAFQLY